ncbi:hypothetical protein AA0117_g13122 [Alternaria alternata]|uniref:Uncharacterized protein n=3 Tax=Alternaria alternata complex TaxID=187734 RepID=A0A4V1WPA3_ALTAL|nr:hypothetical protein AA0115_g12641 [Alternaria tenuissima]RYN55644.1 hypothetical protein AA0114_g3388 [Alternaria tenuissima]RYN59482.1 hypothetical protein AA0117_g13122 [Alternaria alternata]RYO48296.1 hypothetical protein AA0116_g12660 [Alternaria tenuissima]
MAEPFPGSKSTEAFFAYYKVLECNLKLFPKVELFITEDFRVYLMEVGKETWRSENTLSAGLFEAIKHLKKQITCLDRESLNSADGPKEGLGDGGDDDTLYDKE